MKNLIFGMAITACFLSACTNKPGTTTSMGDSTAIKTEKNKQTALSSEQAFSNHDIDGMVKNVAPVFVDYSSGEDKPMTNMDSVKTNLKGFLAAFPNFKGENLKAMGSGDTVVVTGTWSGTFKNAMMGMKPTGKSFKYADADIFTFTKEGKINSHRSVQSSSTFMSQLGISPTAKM